MWYNFLWVFIAIFWAGMAIFWYAQYRLQKKDLERFLREHNMEQSKDQKWQFDNERFKEELAKDQSAMLVDRREPTR